MTQNTQDNHSFSIYHLPGHSWQTFPSLYGAPQRQNCRYYLRSPGWIDKNWEKKDSYRTFL